MDYTRNWTDRLIPAWTEHILPLKTQFPALNILEIGVFEGRTARWLLENVADRPEDRYYGIDPWELTPMDLKKFPRDATGAERIARVESLARANVQVAGGDRATLIKGRSARVLRDGTWSGMPIHLAYIDGIHKPLAVLDDTMLVWPMVMPGGILVWDDYRMKGCHGQNCDRAVDLFVEMAGPLVEVLFRNRQLAIRKLAEESPL